MSARRTAHLAVHFGAYLEELSLLDPLEQVVATALLLHDVAGLVGLLHVSSLLTTS